MLCIVVKGPTLSEAEGQIKKALQCADRVELRLDLLESWNMSSIQKLKSLCPIPLILTLRPLRQGGQYAGVEQERLMILRELASLSPQFMDIEYDVSRVFVEQLKRQFPRVKILISLHDFEKTPTNLSEVLHTISQTPADEYKIATMAKSSLDALRILDLLKNSPVLLSAMAMGPLGEITRILAPIFGGVSVYASLDATQALPPGHISADILLKRYRHRALNKSTSIYGLIGTSIEKSVGHITHNALIQTLGVDAVYVKTKVEEEELGAFINLAQKLGWRGFSVTMPHKEAVLSCLDEIDPLAKQIGAVNTILFQNGRKVGINTDASGALQAIGEVMEVTGKHIVIIGAGGAAKAIAFEALTRGAQLVILNRDRSRALALAQRLKCRGGGLDDLAEIEYDLLINCTPSELPVQPQHLRANTVVMDINNHPRETRLLREATARDCSVVYGYKMFVYQAIRQFTLWFPHQTSPAVMQNALETQIVDNNC